MALCFEMVKRGRTMTVEEALQIDYKMLQSLLNFPDYQVGVHQLLVSKDRTKIPDWHFKSVNDITPAVLDYFFEYPVLNDLSLPTCKEMPRL